MIWTESMKIFWILIEKMYFCSPKKRKNKMAKKSKDQRIQVILECTEQKTSGVPGMSRYITMKNKKNTPERLELKKFNPYLKKVTVHKEIK
jgi:large subunit ribosomal protein L33